MDTQSALLDCELQTESFFVWINLMCSMFKYAAVSRQFFDVSRVFKAGVMSSENSKFRDFFSWPNNFFEGNFKVTASVNMHGGWLYFCHRSRML